MFGSMIDSRRNVSTSCPCSAACDDPCPAISTKDGPTLTISESTLWHVIQVGTAEFPLPFSNKILPFTGSPVFDVFASILISSIFSDAVVGLGDAGIVGIELAVMVG